MTCQETASALDAAVLYNCKLQKKIVFFKNYTYLTSTSYNEKQPSPTQIPWPNWITNENMLSQALDWHWGTRISPFHEIPCHVLTVWSESPRMVMSENSTDGQPGASALWRRTASLAPQIGWPSLENMPDIQTWRTQRGSSIPHMDLSGRGSMLASKRKSCLAYR